MTSLKNLISSLGTSINYAQNTIDLSILKTYTELFIKNNNEVKPKTIDLPIPKDFEHYENKQIPIPALLNYNSLSLDEVSLKVYLTPEWNENSNEVDASFGSRIPEDEQSRHKSPGVLPCELNLNFKRREHPEGIIKHVRELLKTL